MQFFLKKADPNSRFLCSDFWGHFAHIFWTPVHGKIKHECPGDVLTVPEPKDFMDAQIIFAFVAAACAKLNLVVSPHTDCVSALPPINPKLDVTNVQLTDLPLGQEFKS